jgi:hypothetical protein
MRKLTFLHSLPFTIFLLFLFHFNTQAQKPAHRVFFFGNLTDIEAKVDWIKQLEIYFHKNETPFTLIVAGDMVDEKIGKDDREDLLLPVQTLADFIEKTPNGKMLLLPGDRDWNNGKRGGEKSLENLENRTRSYLSDKSYRHTRWLVENACPGPEIIEVDESLVIIAINTQWWNHPYDKPRPSDALCEVITPENLKEELEDAVEEHQDKNILLVGHHPVYSLGNYGGYFSPGDQFKPFPIIGSFRTAFRANVGTSKDLANERLQIFIENMTNLGFFHNNLIYASGHENNQQIIRWGANYVLNSGAPDKAGYAARDRNTVYSESQPGIMELVYFDDGRVDARMHRYNLTVGFELDREFLLFESACVQNNTGKAPENSAYMPCVTKAQVAGEMQQKYEGTIEVVAGPEYKAGGWKKFWLGEHYRTTWMAPVKTSYLDLDETYGGLTIFRKGGGRQTTSLKFKAADGSEYTFRSVNKDPSKALNYKLRPTLASRVLRDQTSTQHPFGAMAVAPLLDKIDILHATPRLFVLPDDPKLGPFRQKFGNLFGMLEESPGRPDKAGNYFGGAKDIERSPKMFRHFYKNQKVKVHKEEFIRARIFDMFVGDWSKHEDNWKWAAYKQDGFTVYRPIPRDRDHVFSRQDGLIPWLADRRFGLPNLENFGFKIPDVQTLTWQARHMDRFLVAEATLDDFRQQVKYIQDHVIDSDIEQAVKNMPPETYGLSGKTIEAKLKKRLRNLPVMVERYYALLAKEVDVVGSKEQEYFEVTHQPGGTLLVRIFDTEGEGRGGSLLYERMFHPGETKEVRLWGLGKKDVFEITGEGKSPIKVRAFGGPGDDLFIDRSAAKTLLYDKGESTAFQVEGNAKIVKHWNGELYEYDRFRFEYDPFFPLVFIGYNNFTGFGVNLGGIFTVRKFGKDDYHSKHSFGVSYTTNGNKSIRYKGRLHQTIRRWDLQWQSGYADPDFFNFFYGLGNNSVKDDDLFKDDFYRAAVTKTHVKLGLVRDFWQKSFFDISLGFEQNESKTLDNTFLDLHAPHVFGAYLKLDILPVEATLDLDFRDSKGLPYRGTKALFSYKNGTILNLDNRNFGVAEGAIEYWLSTRQKHPLTLGLRAGGALSHGDVPWYELPTLGNANGLRGYFDRRFAGEKSAFFNAEFRYQILEKYTSLIPVKVGVKAFYDRGRVFYNGDPESDHWRDGYGFGLYFVPLSERLTLSLSISFSDEESLYPVFGIGTPLR